MSYYLTRAVAFLLPGMYAPLERILVLDNASDVILAPSRGRRSGVVDVESRNTISG